MGVNCYVFNETGTYLGMSGVTSSEGLVSFNLADGSYKFRVDYLGYQFWSQVYIVPDELSASLTVAHQDVTITVEGVLAGDVQARAGLPVYLFTASGNYLNLSEVTDANGQVSLSLPEHPYKVRADYLDQEFWSDEFTWQDTTITIPEGTARVHVTSAGQDLQGAPVYVSSASGGYLNLNETTDSGGMAEFRLPAATYQFRADHLDNQYWALRNTLE